VLSRRFALSDFAFPQFSAIPEAGSIPGSSTTNTQVRVHVLIEFDRALAAVRVWDFRRPIVGDLP
jgi:hypothetical protein